MTCNDVRDVILKSSKWWPHANLELMMDIFNRVHKDSSDHGHTIHLSCLQIVIVCTFLHIYPFVHKRLF